MVELRLLSDLCKLIEEDLGKDAIRLLLEQGRKDDSNTILLGVEYKQPRPHGSARPSIARSWDPSYPPARAWASKARS